MGIVFRQSVKTTLVVFLGAALGAMLRYVYVFALSKQQLGFFTNTINIGAMLQVFVMLGTGAVLCVYIQKYPEDDEKRKVLITFSSLITLFTSLLFAGGFVLFKDIFLAQYEPRDYELVQQYYYYLPLLICLMGFISMFDLYLISQVKIAYSAFVREVLVRVCNLILVGLFFWNVISFHVFIVSSVLMYIIPLFLLFRVSANTKGFGFSFNYKLFTRSETKEIIHFAWYHLLFGASLNILGFMDAIMLGQLDKSGLETIAPYSIAVFIISVISMPYRAMANSSTPILNQAYIENDHHKLSDLFQRSAINILIVAVAMAMLVVCNLDNLVAILPKGYEVVKPVTIILIIGKLADMATGLNSEVIGVSKYYKFNFRISVLLLVMIFFFNKLLIPQYSIYGVAVGVSGALLIFNLLKFLFAWNKLKLQPFSNNTLKVLLCGAIITLIIYYIPFIMNPYVDTVIRSVGVLLIYFIMLLWLKPSKDLQTYLMSIREHKKLF